MKLQVNNRQLIDQARPLRLSCLQEQLHNDDRRIIIEI